MMVDAIIFIFGLEDKALPTNIALNRNKLESFNYLWISAFDKLRKRAFNKRLKKRAFNKRLIQKTKVLNYQTCMLTALLYGSEMWATYSKQWENLSFRLYCKIMNIKWQDKVARSKVVEGDELPSMTKTFSRSSRRSSGIARICHMNTWQE